MSSRRGTPGSLFVPSGDFTDFNGLRKIALRSNEEVPGLETTVASIPSDNAIFGEERGVAKAAQCVSQVRRELSPNFGDGLKIRRRLEARQKCR
jgi:hypothetical protein